MANSPLVVIGNRVAHPGSTALVEFAILLQATPSLTVGRFILRNCSFDIIS
jgi:hypothetical protein